MVRREQKWANRKWAKELFSGGMMGLPSKDEGRGRKLKIIRSNH